MRVAALGNTFAALCIRRKLISLDNRYQFKVVRKDPGSQQPGDTGPNDQGMLSGGMLLLYRKSAIRIHVKFPFLYRLPLRGDRLLGVLSHLNVAQGLALE